MGREWYFNWGSKSSSSKKATTTGGGGSGSEGFKRPTPPPPPAAATMAAAVTGGGCMNALLHLFDFHHFQFCSHPHHENPTVSSSFLSHHHTPLKGVETPSRKSMESSSSSSKEAKPSNFTRRDTKLKLAIQTPSKDDNYHQKQEDSCSEGARTPNLVARLMGLDILPEQSYSNTTTPRSSHYSQSLLSTTTTTTTTPPSSTRKTRPRSMPETPRRSTSTSSSSKLCTNNTHHVLDRHRLSLEFNKENYSIVREMESSRPSCSAISTKRRDELIGRRKSSSNHNNIIEEESKSPRYYARQIMKQVKETVSRRSRRRSFGADITNNTLSVNHQIRRDEHLLLTKPKKTSNINKENSSPKLKSSLEPTTKLSLHDSECAKLETLKLKAIEEKKQQMQEPNKRFTIRSSSVAKPCSKKSIPKSLDPIRKKKEEQFIRPHPGAMRANYDKKCKKTPLSSELLHGSVVPSMVPVNKDYSSGSLPPTKLPHKKGASLKAQSSKLVTSTKAQLSRNSSQGGGKRSQDTISSIGEFQYISRILKCTGIDGNTPVSLTTWFSPSHPLDPSIFRNLETTHYAPTKDDSSPVEDDQLCLSFNNRRLIFHLVGEILAKDYHQQKQELLVNGFELVKMLCERIRSLPCINCHTLQDIDALVEKDLPRFSGVQSNLIAFEEEEGGAIVSEIERDIVDSLVQEIAVFMFCLGMRKSSMQRYVTIIN